MLSIFDSVSSNSNCSVLFFPLKNPIWPELESLPTAPVRFHCHTTGFYWVLLGFTGFYWVFLFRGPRTGRSVEFCGSVVCVCVCVPKRARNRARNDRKRPRFFFFSSFFFLLRHGHQKQKKNKRKTVVEWNRTKKIRPSGVGDRRWEAEKENISLKKKKKEKKIMKSINGNEYHFQWWTLSERPTTSQTKSEHGRVRGRRMRGVVCWFHRRTNSN